MQVCSIAHSKVERRINSSEAQFFGLFVHRSTPLVLSNIHSFSTTFSSIPSSLRFQCLYVLLFSSDKFTRISSDKTAIEWMIEIYFDGFVECSLICISKKIIYLVWYRIVFILFHRAVKDAPERRRRTVRVAIVIMNVIFIRNVAGPMRTFCSGLDFIVWCAVCDVWWLTTTSDELCFYHMCNLSH